MRCGPDLQQIAMSYAANERMDRPSMKLNQKLLTVPIIPNSEMLILNV